MGKMKTFLIILVFFFAANLFAQQWDVVNNRTTAGSNTNTTTFISQNGADYTIFLYTTVYNSDLGGHAESYSAVVTWSGWWSAWSIAESANEYQEDYVIEYWTGDGNLCYLEAHTSLANSSGSPDLSAQTLVAKW